MFKKEKNKIITFGILYALHYLCIRYLKTAQKKDY